MIKEKVDPLPKDPAEIAAQYLKQATATEDPNTLVMRRMYANMAGGAMANLPDSDTFPDSDSRILDTAIAKKIPGSLLEAFFSGYADQIARRKVASGTTWSEDSIAQFVQTEVDALRSLLAASTNPALSGTLPLSSSK